MKRTERVGALIRILTESPNKIYSLQYFCDLFDAAKSSISEDIQSASQAIELTGNDPRLQGRGTFRAGYLAGSSRRAAGGLRAAAVRSIPPARRQFSLYLGHFLRFGSGHAHCTGIRQKVSRLRR